MSDHGPRVRSLRAALAAVVGLLLLAGCVRVDGDLTINGTDSAAPDTVSGTVLVAISDEWALAHGEDPASLSDVIVEELATAADSGVSGEPYSQDGYTGVTLTLDEVPIERISASTDGALSITSEDGGYVIEGDLSVLNPDEDDGVEPTPWSARLAVTLPDEVTQHNGTLDGRTVTWELDETSADPTLFASSVEPPSWWSRVPLPVVLLTLLAGIGAFVAWRLSKRQQEQGGDGGFRARQARAREGSTTKLDDMLAAAKQPERRRVSPGNKPGSKPRRGR